MLKTKHGAQSHPSASTQRSHPHDMGQGGKHGAQYENTFKLEPDDTFPSAPIKKIINEILQVGEPLNLTIIGEVFISSKGCITARTFNILNISLVFQLN